MHELSIAMSIIDMAAEELARRQGARIDAVHLKIGALSGVVPRALSASYDLACEDTPLAGSRLVIEEVPILIYCARCDAARAVNSIQSFCCAACGTPGAEVVQGRELQVVALELAEMIP
jgi:hydrogenase nickel incorporation protein HypA/HybF